MGQTSEKSYSDRYGYHISHIQFDCGGVNMGNCPHGTLSTEGIEKSNPKKYTSDKPFPKMELEKGTSSSRTHEKQETPRNPLGPCYVWPVGSKRGTKKNM